MDFKVICVVIGCFLALAAAGPVVDDGSIADNSVRFVLKIIFDKKYFFLNMHARNNMSILNFIYEQLEIFY